MKFQAETNNSPLPSTSPCLPAPGRRLLIIRNDNPLPTAPLYLGFDGFVSRGCCRNLAQISSFNRNSSPSPVSTPDSNSSDLNIEPCKNKLSNETQFSNITSIKKRWSLLGKVFFFSFFEPKSTPSSDKLIDSPPTIGSVSDDEETSQSSEDCKNITPLKSHNTDFAANEKKIEATTVYRAFSFRFSLELGAQFENGNSCNFGSGNSVTNGTHVNSSGITASGPGLGERRLSPPRLPAPAQVLLAAKVPGVSREITPKDWSLTGNYVDLHSNIAPRTLAGGTSEKRSSALVTISHDENPLQSKTRGNLNTVIKKENFVGTSIYKGRALAEWAIVVGECNGFLERRRNEGVPNLKLVEVPLLGVEGFRRYG